ncbi:unnamed protein product [Owenia fusiformis]|uniref:Uncharacterized protein n=1 Tax=Owenia fusiformis TaxID=6347 RepID=A0A8S4MU04_OWEFU|nr:unnamed protein product [Owenia fusiformis]
MADKKEEENKSGPRYVTVIPVSFKRVGSTDRYPRKTDTMETPPNNGGGEVNPSFTDDGSTRKNTGKPTNGSSSRDNLSPGQPRNINPVGAYDNLGYDQPDSTGSIRQIQRENSKQNGQNGNTPSPHYDNVKTISTHEYANVNPAYVASERDTQYTDYRDNAIVDQDPDRVIPLPTGVTRRTNSTSSPNKDKANKYRMSESEYGTSREIPKKENTKKIKWGWVIFSFIIVILLFAGTILFVYFYFSKASDLDNVSPDYEEALMYQGCIKYNTSWSDELDNSTSDLYKRISSDFIKNIDKIYSESDIAVRYVKTEVFNITNGSLVVNFHLFFDDVLDNVQLTVKKVSDTLNDGLKTLEESNELPWPIIREETILIPIYNIPTTPSMTTDSVDMTTESTMTTTSETTTTKSEATTTIETTHTTVAESTTKDDTTTEGDTTTTTTTEKPSTTTVHPLCEKIYLEECLNISYSYAIFPNFEGHNTQNDPRVKTMLESFAATQASGCHEHALLFGCAYIVPKCFEGFRLSPCRLFCDEFNLACNAAYQCIALEDEDDDTFCVSPPQPETPITTVGPTVPECNEYMCLSGECLSQAVACDNKTDCSDNSDEIYCGKTSEWDCNFDDGSLCGYDGDAGKWNVLKGATPSILTGPSMDNTLKSIHGGYALFEASGYGSGMHGTSAWLQSTVLDLSTTHCLQFYYNMHGQDVISLKIYRTTDGVKELAWTKQDDHGNRWLLGYITIPPGVTSYYFETLRGRSFRSDVAIDDISLRQGACLPFPGCAQDEFHCGAELCIPSIDVCDDFTHCPGKQDELNCECPKGQYHCSDGSCIMSEWLCDGMKDCPNGQDELNCSQCTSDEFQCSNDYSCVETRSRCNGTAECIDGSDEHHCLRESDRGVVEVLHQGEWLAICTQDLNYTPLTGLCRTLGKGQLNGTSSVVESRSSYAFLTSYTTGIELQGLVEKRALCNNNEVLTVQCFNRGCGESSLKIEQFIFGGEEAALGRWPWQVSIQFDTAHVCGGSLIGPYHVLTAAHCIFTSQFNKFQVVLGTTKRTEYQDSKVKIGVREVWVHNGYRQFYNEYDAAIILLKEKVEYTEYIKPVCLPEKDDLFTSSSYCYISGFGFIDKAEQNLAEDLQEAKMQVVTPLAKCARNWGSYVYWTDKMICAGYESGLTTICKGDSGGPLVCQDEHQRWKLAGITSFAWCAREKKPAAFTKVAAILDWIDAATSCKFVCDNGQCIYAERQLCDGKNDCGDNSDEDRLCDKSIECSFEDAYICGYRKLSKDTNWERRKGNTPTSNTGPFVDNTFGNSSGHYLYIESSDTKRGDQAVVLSPYYNRTTRTCLQFYYHMHGNDIGQLRVHVHFPPMSLWYLKGNHGNRWRLGQITLDPGIFQIGFEATAEDGIYGDLAIDDVTLLDGDCPVYKCDWDEFKCATVEQCIPWDYKCNRIVDCLDMSDEFNCTCYDDEFRCNNSLCIEKSKVCDKYNDCYDRSDESGCYESINCTFEEPFLCGYNWENDYRFTAENGLVHGIGRPQFDATFGHPTGSFLFARFQSAVVVSPMYRAVRVQCFRFTYWVHGNNKGLLTVNQRIPPRNDNETSVEYSVLSVFGFEGYHWLTGQADVAEGDFQLVFRVTAITADMLLHISIDDVTIFEEECKDIPCREGYFTCKDRFQCIPQMYKCNILNQCLDKSDETNCTAEGIIPLFACSFEEPYLCGLQQDVHKGFEWTIANGDTTFGERMPPRDHTFDNQTVEYVKGFEWTIANGDTTFGERMPPRDHTFDNQTGKYLVANSTKENLFIGARGHVLMNISITSIHCMTMHYYMDGNDMGTMNVYTARYLGASPQLIFSTSGNQGQQWIKAQFDIPADTELITIEAVLGGIRESNMAIDDIVLEAGACKAACLDGMFTCDNGRCIPESLVCTRTDECGDFSDEKNCTCTDSEFKCDNGVCQSIYFWCDGYNHCGDASDEPINCQCREEQFRCGTGLCIPGVYYCDGVEQCEDGSDEPANCSCDPRWNFLCDNGYCVYKQYKCDGVNQCGDYSDELDCVCQASDFTCDSGMCIRQEQYCDGKPHCSDASDEPANCTCSENQFRCNSGQCIPKSDQCNRIYNCRDFSDEKDCECRSDEFKCKLGVCIPASLRCDGTTHCPGETSDEEGCACGDGKFLCDNGVCLLSYYHCNGQDECGDNTDEMHCQCRYDEYTCPDGACIQNELVCDGHKDCTSGQDEANCNTCGADKFQCQDYSCVPESARCDGVIDCPSRNDEADCVKLTEISGANIKQKVDVLNGTIYHPVCADTWNEAWSDVVCSQLGEGPQMVTSKSIQASNSYYRLSSSASLPTDFLQGNLEMTDQCPNNEVVTTTCEHRDCGLRSDNITFFSAFIIGGNIALEGAWPWMASIQYLGQHRCGGTLINKQWILTAAHCFHINRPHSEHLDRMPYYFSIVLGSANQRTPSTHGVKVSVESIHLHSGYSFGYNPLLNDIALVKLSKLVEYTDYIRPACVPEPREIWGNTSVCYLTGWGHTQIYQEYAVPKLREAKMRMIPSQTCSERILTTDNQYLCAGYATGYVGGCEEDSGGPLVCMDMNKRWNLLGTYSGGPMNCGVGSGVRPVEPNVFARITHFSTWMDSIMRLNR